MAAVVLAPFIIYELVYDRLFVPRFPKRNIPKDRLCNECERQYREGDDPFRVLQYGRRDRKARRAKIKEQQERLHNKDFQATWPNAIDVGVGAKDQTGCLLLKLPYDMRSMIYRELLTGMIQPVAYYGEGHCHLWASKCAHYAVRNQMSELDLQQGVHQISLLQTCRAMCVL